MLAGEALWGSSDESRGVGRERTAEARSLARARWIWGIEMGREEAATAVVAWGAEAWMGARMRRQGVAVPRERAAGGAGTSEAQAAEAWTVRGAEGRVREAASMAAASMAAASMAAVVPGTAAAVTATAAAAMAAVAMAAAGRAVEGRG